jgi:hypothetical protein
MSHLSTTRLTRSEWVSPHNWLWPGLIIGLGLLPIWMVRYPALNDYPSHLLEAQVVAHYHNPALAYAPDYQILPGWYLHSNALTTLLMVGLAQVAPIALAGKLVLSLYVVLLTTGVIALLDYFNRPRWLLLALPVLLFNLPFMSGFLNWSYGVALIPFVLLSYCRWRQGQGWHLGLLAGLTLLIYIAHVLAWGLGLVMLYTFAVADGLSLRRYAILSGAASSALPILALSRPDFMLGAIALAAAFWLGGVVIRRFRLKPAFLFFMAYTGAVVFLAVTRIFKGLRLRLFPFIDFNLQDKFLELVRTFTLPYQQPPVHWDIVGASLVILLLWSGVVGILVWSSLARRRSQPFERGGVAALSVLGVIYLISPSGTGNIFILNPRVLLLACIVGLSLVQLPPGGSRLYRMLIVMLSLLAGLSFLTVSVYAWRHDQTARQYSRELDQIPPARRVLVLPNFLHVPSGSPVMLLFQRYSGHHFVSTYALEKGGFVSSTFFNGPLRPLHPHLIPDEVFDRRYIEFVRKNCVALRTVYDYIVLWNPGEAAQLEALRECGAEPVYTGPVIAIWKWRS